MTDFKGNKLTDSPEDKLENTKSVLKNDASIYDKHHDDKQDLKKTWHTLNRKEKWQFFKDYYLVKLLVAIIACSAVIYTLVITLGPHTEKVFYAAVLQDSLDTEGVKNMESDLSDLLHVGKHEIVSIDTSFNFSDENTTFSGSDKLTTILYSELIDVIITSPEHFEEYAYYGDLKNLSTYLPDDILNALSDCLISSKVNEDEESSDQSFDDAIYGTNEELKNDTHSKKYVVGIDLTKSKKYMALNPRTEKPILSVAYNAPNKENTFKAIRYLFDLPQPDEKEK